MTMTKQRYELIGDSKVIGGIKVHQIRAIRNFSNVKAGDLGGWIASEHNLPQEGQGWAYPNAVIHSGNIHGGKIYGGDIYSGSIYGGSIYGGSILGGNIYGGSIHGGRIVGGKIYGGKFYGGEIHGGEIHGGEIHIGEIHGGEIWSCDDLVVLRSRFLVTITSSVMTIGCWTYSVAEWMSFSDEEIAVMGMLPWWRLWRPIIRAAVKTIGTETSKPEK